MNQEAAHSKCRNKIRQFGHSGGKKWHVEGKWTEKGMKQKRNKGWEYKNGTTKETMQRRQEKITTLVVGKAWLPYTAIVVT
jgi:hypothetical protein